MKCQALTLLLIAGTLSFGGCSTATKEEIGAATGAILGGALGYGLGKGHKDKGMAIAIGALFGAMAGNQIGQHVALAHEIHRLEVRKRRRADLAAIGFVRTIAHQIDAELPLGAFGRDIDLARRHVEAFGVELEVMDQRFHRLLHFAALGRCDLAVVAGDRA